MKKYIQKILRRWAIRFFQKQIKVFAYSIIISPYELRVMEKEELESYRKINMIRGIVEMMHDQKRIEFSEWKDAYGASHIEARINII